jgi:hypothetical protein
MEVLVSLSSCQKKYPVAMAQEVPQVIYNSAHLLLISPPLKPDTVAGCTEAAN